MTIEGLTNKDLEEAVSSVNHDIRRLAGSQAAEPLRGIRDQLTGMLVAGRELENLDKLHRRGDLVTDVYLDRRKKLTTDFYGYRNELLEISVPAFVDSAPSPEKSRLRAMGQSLKESKEFLLSLMNLISAVIGVFGK